MNCMASLLTRCLTEWLTSAAHRMFLGTVFIRERGQVQGREMREKKAITLNSAQH